MEVGSILLSNLWMLCVFGVALESMSGPARFAAIYFCLGAIAVLCQGVLHSAPFVPIIGASGAISGVFGCYLVACDNKLPNCIRHTPCAARKKRHTECAGYIGLR